jgi:peptidyl-dipeptidase Dcp
VAGRLYRLRFEERRDVTAWHEDVRVFRVSRDGALVGLFYVDLFPRDTKQGGAWQTTLRDQGTWRGEMTRPHVAIVCNFTPPAGEQPSLLRLDEVRTLFHEFGHALHSLLSECRYQSMGGTSVYWDFVELPSQIMENWITETDALALFAGHWQTGDPVPADLIEKVKKVRRFQAGYSSLRQLNFALLDMAWHLNDPGEVGDVADFERERLASTRVLPLVEGTASSPAFSHIFAGGYSSGYYSYKWAEVLEADAFEQFQAEGIFNPATAESFRANVLSRGNSAHPMDLYVAFRGRKPDPDALLRRDGLLA